MTEKDKALEQLDINENAPAEEEKVTEESPAEKAEEDLEEAAEAAVEPEAEETEAEETEAEEAEAEEEAETSEEEVEEEVKVYEPHEKKAEEAPALISEQQNADAPRAEPQRQNVTPAVQYSKSLERERKIAQEVKKRQRRPMVFILAMCALLIVLAIIVNAVLKDLDGGHASPTPVPTQTVIVPDPTPALAQTQQPEPSYVPIVEASPEPETPKTSTYEIFKEDISWTAARDKCIEMGGHLAVISTQEEFDRVVAIARTQGVEKLWIGCQRVNGNMVWVTDDLVEYYPWAKGEPTGYDSFDGAAEDYVLLWNNNGWYYNDSRNDPAAEFPQWYSGTIGYICEFEE